MFPKPNLHIIDRIIRIMFGMFLIYIGFIDEAMIRNNTVSMLVALFGAINIGVAFVRHCPLYSTIGLNTYKQKDENKGRPSA